jgi:hypothetical protein
MGQYLAIRSPPIAEWRPIHDQIVALHLAGYGPKQIAEITGRSRGSIREILDDPRAQKVMETVRKHAFGRLAGVIEDRMVGLGVKAIENIADTIDCDLRDAEGKIPVGSKSKKHQDAVSFELLKRIGYGGSNGDEEKERRPLMSKDTERRLVEGIERATQAQIQYDAAEQVEVEVIDDRED